MTAIAILAIKKRPRYLSLFIEVIEFVKLCWCGLNFFRSVGGIPL